MKNIQLFTLLLLLVMGTAVSHAQDSKLKKANECFVHYDYPVAAELYKKILAKEDVPEALMNLAECYRQMNMPVEAEYWYEQVIELPESEAIHKYFYGMSLKANGKFDEAKEKFLEYAQLVPADSRGLRQVEACEQAVYFLTDPGVYQLTLASSVNSGLADFGAAFYKEGIVYASEENVKNKDQIYGWTEAPFLDLFYAKVEGDTPAALSKPEIFKGKVNTWVHEGTVSFSRDFKTMYFTRDNFYKGRIRYDSEEEVETVNLQIFESKSTGEDKWGDVKPLPFNSDDYSVGHPSLSFDEQALYFVSDMPGGFGGTDIYVSYRSGDSWGQPENLGPEINTEGNEMFPFIAQDGTLYFSSNALPGLGGLDVFATKLLEDGTWSAPENLRYPINTNADDFSFIINVDNEKGYLSSNRPGGKGDDDIYSFTKLTNIMTGVVVDCNTQEVIEGAMVQLMENGNLMQKKKTLSNGTFNFPISPGKNYTVQASKSGYDSWDQTISTVGMNGTTIEVKIPLCPEGGNNNCVVTGVIHGKDNNNPVSGTIVKVVNIETREEQTFVTGDDGVYTFELDPESEYTISSSKDKYWTETTPISTIGRDCSDPLHRDMAVDIPIGPMPPMSADGTPLLDDNGNRPKVVVGGGDPDIIGHDPNNPTGNPYDPNNPTGRGALGYTPPSSGNNIDYLPDWFQLNHIYYDFDQHYIRADAEPDLDKVVRLMHENPAISMEVGSHTDSRGTHEYNQALSERRAQAAVDYIVGKGIPRANITSQGYGEGQLANECSDGADCTEAKHQENRRTEFTLTGYNPSGPNTSLPRYFGQADYGAGEYYKQGMNYYYTGSGIAPPSGIGDVPSGTAKKSVYKATPVAPSSDTFSDDSGSDVGTSNGSMSSGSTTSYSAGTTSYDTTSPTVTTSDDVAPTIYDTQLPPINTGNDCCDNVGTEYKIQLGAYKDADLTRFSSLNDLGYLDIESTAKGMQRIILGGFMDNDNVEEALYQVKQRGFNDAFVVKYQNGLRVGR